MRKRYVAPCMLTIYHGVAPTGYKFGDRLAAIWILREILKMTYREISELTGMSKERLRQRCDSAAAEHLYKPPRYRARAALVRFRGRPEIWLHKARLERWMFDYDHVGPLEREMLDSAEAKG